MGTERVDRGDPDELPRTARALQKVSEIFNDLIATDDIIKVSGVWRINPARIESLSRSSSLLGSFGDGFEGPPGPPGPVGPRGATGATGPAGADGSGGSRMAVPVLGDPDWEDGGGVVPLSIRVSSPAPAPSGIVETSRLGWPVYARCTTDETVENSSTLTDSTQLQVAVTAGIWEFVLMILYSGNNAAMDFKFDLQCTAGTLEGYFRNLGNNTTADAILDQQIRVPTGANAWAAPISAGTDAADTVRYVRVHGIHSFTNDCTVKLRFANVTPALGRICTLSDGSYMAWRKVR